jgi:hypothetical protein
MTELVVPPGGLISTSHYTHDVRPYQHKVVALTPEDKYLESIPYQSRENGRGRFAASKSGSLSAHLTANNFFLKPYTPKKDDLMQILNQDELLENIITRKSSKSYLPKLQSKSRSATSSPIHDKKESFRKDKDYYHELDVKIMEQIRESG